MNRDQKFSSQRQREIETGQERLAAGHSQRAPLEFGSVEQMLRHDALHTPVPPSIEHRLARSLAEDPPRPRPWWRRWLGL